MCEEVNARHAAQPGSGSIALYRRLRLGQWWSVEWHQMCIRPNIPSNCRRPRPCQASPVGQLLERQLNAEALSARLKQGKQNKTTLFFPGSCLVYPGGAPFSRHWCHGCNGHDQKLMRFIKQNNKHMPKQARKQTKQTNTTQPNTHKQASENS